MVLNKRGLSHVEFIVSLVIFVTFVLFLLSFLSPFENNSENTVVLDVLEKQIEAYSTIEVITGSAIVNNSGMNDCFSIESLSKEKVKVKKDNVGINAENKGSGDIDTNIENKGSGIYSLYYSDIFDENSISGNCRELSANDYTFGLTRENDFISFEKLQELSSIYNNRYADAKEALKISDKNDFGFIVYDLNGTEILRAFKQKTTSDIKARDINIETIDSKADVKSVIINIRIW